MTLTQRNTMHCHDRSLSFCRWVVFCLALSTTRKASFFSNAFTLAPSPRVHPAFRVQGHCILGNSKNGVPEYSFDGETEDISLAVDRIDEDDDDTSEEVELQLDDKDDFDEEDFDEDYEDPTYSPTTTFEDQQSPGQPANSNRIQYAALEPGTVLQIQVGDTSLARKAWKKRRRSGSPLLVPCSVLNVDRTSTVRWNLIYLLQKFGSKHAKTGIRITLQELTKRHRTHLKCSLQDHATALGYETTADLIQGLFHKQVQDTYGVKLVVTSSKEDTGSKNIWLEAPVSRMRAQKLASSAAVLQFTDAVDRDQIVHDGGSTDTLRHTGIVRNKRQRNKETSDEDGAKTFASTESNVDSIYELQPLSAALRVNKDDVLNGNVQNGSMHPAVVFDYDLAGDAGSPLLTLSLNPSRNQARDKLKITPKKSVNYQQAIRNPKWTLNDLSVGSGPLNGKVVDFIKGGVLVDCSVGRETNDSDGPAMVKVLGTLKFPDAITREAARQDDSVGLEDLVEEDELGSDISDLAGLAAALTDFDDDGTSEVEDITHLFKLGEDGALTYKDPETGEISVLDTESDADDTDESMPVTRSRRKKSESKTHTQSSSSLRPQRLHVGDEIEVFVKSVSKQSHQLHFTMDSSVQGKKAKELKKEGEVSKRLARLSKQLGGLHHAARLKGTECDAVVQAASYSGDWFYVRPIECTDPDQRPLPVGVGTITSEELLQELDQGDSVRIAIAGIDEERGQMEYKILHKLAP